MDRDHFRDLVSRAIDDLPDEFRERLENVDVVVADYASSGQLDRVGAGRKHRLLGLYQGVPLTRRGRGYGMVPPDKITIFQKPIESICHNDEEIVTEVGRVVRHEIAHHFGIGDDRLRELEGRGS